MAQSSENEIQGIGVISCSNLTPSQIIEKIIGTSYDPSNHVQLNFGTHLLSCYPWHLSTKYYDADIHFIGIVDRDLIGAQFAETIQTIIIYLDNNDESFCTKFHSWKPFIDEYDPDIRLLVVETAREDSFFDRTSCMKWCINNEFELVELEPEAESDDEYENDFVDSYGTKRIMQALSAHTWPMMEMRDTPTYKPSPKFENLLKKEFQSSLSTNDPLNPNEDENQSDSKDHELDETSDISTRQRIDSIIEEDKDIFDRLGDGTDLEVEDLFGKFKDLKKKAETLTGEERRLYAEKITIAFWRSLGGSADEIAGLDD